MTPKERALAAMEGRPLDRPANMPITMQFAARRAGICYRDYATRAELQAAAQIAVARDFDFDHVSVISDPATEAHDLGAAVIFADNSPPAMDEVNALLRDTAALASLRLPDPHKPGSRMANRLELIRLFHRSVGQTHLIEGWVEGPCAESADLRGINELMVDFYEEPAFVCAVADFCTEMAMRFATAQIEAGATLIGVGDAACSLVSHDLYREFIWPRQKRLVDHIHACGAKARLHVCGNIAHLVGDFAELGFDLYDIDYPVALHEARNRMGGAVLVGNLHPVQVVRQGSPEGIRAALAECHAAAGKAWILGAGCELPVDTPDANVAAFADYARGAAGGA